MELLELFKVVFGSIFVLFLPGFVWSFIFFQKKDIDAIERIALSFALSIALVPLVVFWVNWILNVKISLVNTSIVVTALILLPLAYPILVQKKRLADFREIQL